MPNLAIFVTGPSPFGVGVGFLARSSDGLDAFGEVVIDFAASAVIINQAIVTEAVRQHTETYGTIFEPTDVKMLFGGRATN